MLACEDQKIATLDDLCRAMAPVFEAMGLPAPSAMDVLGQLANEENARLNTLNAQLNQQSTRQHERTFLRDEKGHAFGHVKAEIPAELYTNLAQHKSFGREALNTPEGIEEVLKAFPACRVKNVQLKYHSHTGAGRRGYSKINWGGRMKFAT